MHPPEWRLEATCFQHNTSKLRVLTASCESRITLTFQDLFLPFFNCVLGEWVHAHERHPRPLSPKLLGTEDTPWHCTIDTNGKQLSC